jgi:hypothetical protein
MPTPSIRWRARARVLCVVVALLVVTEGTSSGQAAPAAARPPAPPAVSLDLSVPDSAAFIILGVSPTEIARPATPAALAASIASSAQGSTNLIPTNYALEVAPYWMGHTSLQLADYMKPGFVQSMAQTLSVSFGTAKSDLTPDSTGVSFGANVSLKAGRASTAFREAMASMSVDRITYLGLRTALRALTAQLNAATVAYNKTHVDPKSEPSAAEKAAFDKLAAGFGSLPTQVDELIKASVNASSDTELTPEQLAKVRETVIASLAPRMAQVYRTVLSPTTHPLAPLADAATRLLPPVTPVVGDPKADINFVTAGIALGRIIEAMDAMKTAARNAIEEGSAAIQAADKLRRGFMFAVAGGAATDIPDSSFTDAALAQWGIWATPAWRLDSRPIEMLGLVRYIRRSRDEGPNLTDLGARVVQHFNNVTWSAEFLQRFERDANDTSVSSQRLTANFEYKIREQMFLTAAFGKDFADPQAGQPKGGLVSLLGINFGFGRKPSIPIPGVPID